MRNLRVSRKVGKPLGKQTSINARDIILSIFSIETEAEKLQYSKQTWNKTEIGNRSNVLDSSFREGSQPLKYLYPFLQHIANEMQVDTPSYLFVDGNSLRIVHKDKRVTISKSRFTSSKVKYWLSHIYFSRYRTKFSQKLLTEPTNTARGTVNVFE